jgi:hypothetical protein
LQVLEEGVPSKRKVFVISSWLCTLILLYKELVLEMEGSEWHRTDL